jgi:hypothetical protein
MACAARSFPCCGSCWYLFKWLHCRRSLRRKRDRLTWRLHPSFRTSVRPFVLWSSFAEASICENGRSYSHTSRKRDNKIWPNFLHLSTNLGEIRDKVLTCYNNNEEGWFSEMLTVINDENDIIPIFYACFFSDLDKWFCYVKWFCFEVKWSELRWSSWGQKYHAH